MPITLDSQGENKSSPLLDAVFGTADTAIDIWQKWTNGKTQATQTKAAIPSTTVPPVATSSAVDKKTVIIAASVVGGLVLVAIVVFRGRGK